MEITKKEDNFANGRLARNIYDDLVLNHARRVIKMANPSDEDRAAGSELLAECRTLQGCKTGEAKITKGYKLPAKHVIHTVGPIYSGRNEDAEALRNCYWNSLELAVENNIHSIAFPAISTGVYGYPLQAATNIAIMTVKKWLDKHSDYAIQVIFTCFDEKTYA